MYSLCRYSHHGELLLMPFINQAVLDNNNNDNFNTTAAETTASRPRVDIATAAVAATLISQVLYLCCSCLDIYNHSYYYLCYSSFCCCYCNIYYISATYLHIVLREVVFAMCSPVFRPAGGEWSREDLYFSHADRRHDHHLRRGFP